jgi:hypothetical protein
MEKAPGFEQKPEEVLDAVDSKIDEEALLEKLGGGDGANIDNLSDEDIDKLARKMGLQGEDGSPRTIEQAKEYLKTEGKELADKIWREGREGQQ